MLVPQVTSVKAPAFAVNAVLNSTAISPHVSDRNRARRVQLAIDAERIYAHLKRVCLVTQLGLEPGVVARTGRLNGE